MQLSEHYLALFGVGVQATVHIGTGHVTNGKHQSTVLKFVKFASRSIWKLAFGQWSLDCMTCMKSQAVFGMYRIAQTFIFCYSTHDLVRVWVASVYSYIIFAGQLIVSQHDREILKRVFNRAALS